MFFSAVIGKKRVLTNAQPTFANAWALVIVDIAVMVIVLGLLFMPIMTLIYVSQPSEAATGFFLFVLYLLVPLGIVFNAIRWAMRSRRRY